MKSESKEPWEVVPTLWIFDLSFDIADSAKQIISTAYGPANQRIFVGQAFGDGIYPLLHVFKSGLEGITTPATSDNNSFCVPIKTSKLNHALICLQRLLFVGQV